MRLRITRIICVVDVHVTLDSVIIMSHDPDLARTTDSTGLIRERNWYGEDGMEHVKTIREPKQPMPMFTEVIALLMLPENHHVKFNVRPLQQPLSPFGYLTLMSRSTSRSRTTLIGFSS